MMMTHPLRTAGAARRSVILLAALVALGLAAAGGALFYFGAGTNAQEKAKKAGRPVAAVPVGVVAAERRSTPVRIGAIGNIEPYSSVALKARVDGQITEVNFREGQEVRRGDVLFRIDARPFEAALRQAEANAMRDAAARDQAASQARRYEELLAKNFVSSESYAQMRTNAATAEATSKASQAALENARLNLEYCVIRSPLDGFVGRVLLQVGNLVKANDVTPLVVINQVRPILATFAVPEQALPEIRRRNARTPLEVSVSAPDAGRLLARGQLVFIDNAVDPSTGTIKLRARFDNRDTALWPGQFVNLSVKLYDDPATIVIPSAAVQTGPAGQYVYVVTPDLAAEVRKVSVGRTEGEIAIIERGLEEDEKVVTRGALRLSPGARVQIVKGEGPS